MPVLEKGEKHTRTVISNKTDQGTMFMLWSKAHNLPASEAMKKNEFVTFLKKEYRDKADVFMRHVENIENNSLLSQHPREIIAGNKAGKFNQELSLERLFEVYSTTSKEKE